MIDIVETHFHNNNNDIHSEIEKIITIIYYCLDQWIPNKTTSICF